MQQSPENEREIKLKPDLMFLEWKFTYVDLYTKWSRRGGYEPRLLSSQPIPIFSTSHEHVQVSTQSNKCYSSEM